MPLIDGVSGGILSSPSSVSREGTGHVGALVMKILVMKILTAR